MNPKEILSKIRRIELRTRRLVEASFAGQYHSVFKGRGMNFEEVREYSPGDEIRSIDWNVTARMDRPFIKKFTEERELSVMLVVDVSASGKFGSIESSKREVAAEAAAILAFSALRNADKVGLLLFSSQTELLLPPAKGRQHILRVIREVLFYQPNNKGTNVAAALAHVQRLLSRRAVIFFFSDFISAPFERELAVLARKHDFVAAPVRDPKECELPETGLVVFEDAETGELIELNTRSPETRRLYAEAQEKRWRGLLKIFASHGVDCVPLRTDQDVLKPLRAFFENRERRLAPR